jgi:catechol 2,3-dioxygenase-like lactoylglutathione lyase family enzyme
MITHVGKVTIYVSSQTEAKAFWVDGLGFEVTFEQKAGPILWLEVAPPGKNLTSLVLYDKAAMLAVHPEAVAHPTIIFEADEIDAFWNLLRSGGGYRWRIWSISLMGRCSNSTIRMAMNTWSGNDPPPRPSFD